MSPNSESPVARFLFAILKQKSLKDIDWDEVARDPVLVEPITNGHAARMRFSRFKTSVQGDAKKGSSSSGNKNRVNKAKKAPKKEGYIKAEYESAMGSYPQFSPASTTSPYIGDTSDDFGDRFPTPFSDDMVIVPSTTMKNSTGDNFSAGIEGIDCNADFMNATGSDFETNFDIYKAGTGDFQNEHQPELSDPHQSLADCAREWTERYHDQHLF